MSTNQFGRFAPEAVNALVVAQQHVVARGGQGVEPEHLLLAFLDPPGEPLSDHLHALGFAVDRAIAIIDTQLPKHDPPYYGEIGLTLAAKYAIEAAVSEFQTQGAMWLDNRHLLLGILRQTDNPILITLQQNGIDLIPLQDQLCALPPPTWGIFSPRVLLRASPRFVTLAIVGLPTLAALALPLPAWAANALPYLSAMIGWVILWCLLNYTEARDRYRRGERGGQLRSLHTLDPKPTAALFLSLPLPILLLLIAQQFFHNW